MLRRLHHDRGERTVPAVNLHTIRFRWRMASDTSGSNEGWRIDTVSIIWCEGQGPPCTPTPTPPITPKPPGRARR